MSFFIEHNVLPYVYTYLILHEKSGSSCLLPLAISENGMV